MATDVYEVYNLALSRLGVKQWVASGDTTVEAELCAMHFAAARDQVATEFAWGFLGREVLLEEPSVATSSVTQTGTGLGDGPTFNDVTSVVGTWRLKFTVAAAATESTGATFTLKVNDGTTSSAVEVDSPVALSSFGVTDTTLSPVLVAMTVDDGAYVLGDTYTVTISDGKSERWEYAYAAPDDLLQAREIWNGARVSRRDNLTPFQVGMRAGTKVIWTDIGPDNAPVLIYTAQADDVTLWPTLFTECVAAQLAARMAMPLTAQADMRRAALADYYHQLGIAKAHESGGEQSDPDPESEFISCRE